MIWGSNRNASKTKLGYAFEVRLCCWWGNLAAPVVQTERTEEVLSMRYLPVTDWADSILDACNNSLAMLLGICCVFLCGLLDVLIHILVSGSRCSHPDQHKRVNVVFLSCFFIVLAAVAKNPGIFCHRGRYILEAGSSRPAISIIPSFFCLVLRQVRHGYDFSKTIANQIYVLQIILRMRGS